MNDYEFTNRFTKIQTKGNMAMTSQTMTSQTMTKDTSITSTSLNPTSITFIINKVNKVNDFKYLYNTKFRKEILESINSCRTNPDYISSKIHYPLKKIKPMTELITKNELCQAGDDLMVLIKLYNNDLSDDQKSKTRSRINKYGASYGFTNEIVIIGYSDIDTFLCNLLNSENRDIILNPELNYMGLAIDITLDNNLCIILNFTEHFFSQGDIIPSNILKKYAIEKKYLVPQETTYKEAVLLNQSTVNPGIRRTKSIKPEFSIKSDRITHFSTDYGIEERHTTKVRKIQPDVNYYNETIFSNKTHVPNPSIKWNDQSYVPKNTYKDEIKNVRITETPEKKGSIVKKVINYTDGSSETFIFKKD